MSRRLALLVLLCTGIAAGAASAGQPQNSRDERAIARLMNDAIGAVERRRECRPPRPPLGRRPSFTDDPPSGELLLTLGVLRRPQTEEEREALDSIRFLSAEGVYRGHVRIARAASGAAFLIVPARDVSFYEPRPARCVKRLRRRFGQLIETRPRPFRRRARRTLESIIRTEWTAPSEGEVEGVFMLDYEANEVSGGAGGVSAGFIRREGLYGSRGRTARSRVSALLPDGVATLEATFAPARGAKRVTRTVSVQDNVVSFRVPRAPQDAFPARQVWRSTDGSVIREIARGGSGP